MSAIPPPEPKTPPRYNPFGGQLLARCAAPEESIDRRRLQHRGRHAATRRRTAALSPVRFHRSNPPVIRYPKVVVALALIVVGLAGCATDVDRQVAKADSPGQFVPVLYAVDGDTLRVRLLEGRLAYVRLVGIDTPEDVRPGSPIECGSKQAAASMRQLAPDGATVLLRPDSVADATDRYGRILAHAFVKGRQLELAQLRRGWAYVYRYDNQRFDGLPAFEAAERHARQAHLFFWGLCRGDFHSAEPGDQN